jgi:uncharacterized membrane protein YedE/YeeE
MSRSVDYTADQDGAAAAPGSSRTHAMVWVGYLATGTALGILFMKSEVLTWYRMQEMFRFQSIHMFGIIGVAILVAMVSQLLLTRVQARTMTGEPIHVSPKVATPAGTRYWGGGFVFGLGWALLGACPGPIFTLIGAGHSVYVVPLAAAVAGTYLYGAIQPRVPH